MDLIAISSSRIGAQEVQTVNARELHAFLEVQSHFKDWIARRITEYGFMEGRDFCSFLSESSGGRPATEYAVTLDMAKELSMVERNNKGREARAYFIDCERRAVAAAQAQPAPAPAELSRMDILRLAMESEEAKIKAEAALALAAPKVELVDRYMDATGTQTFRQVAKLLQAKEPAFRAFLAAHRILYQIGGTWTPYAEHLDAGRFVVKVGNADNGHAFSAARFTPKGVAWVAGLWVDAVGAKG